MPNVKISEMTAASSLTGEEIVPVVQGGENRRTTVQAILDLVEVPEDTDDQSAAEVSYDNGVSGLSANNVQTAIDELASEIGGNGGGALQPLLWIQRNFFAHPTGQRLYIDETGAASVVQAADGITYVPETEAGEIEIAEGGIYEITWHIEISASGNSTTDSCVMCGTEGTEPNNWGGFQTFVPRSGVQEGFFSYTTKVQGSGSFLLWLEVLWGAVSSVNVTLNIMIQRVG